MNKRILMSLVIGASLIPGLRAQETAPPPGATPPVLENKGTSKQVSKLATDFGVAEGDITALRGQGKGWGEIGNALAIAQKAGVPLSDVAALRDSGMGWGQIAQKYGFKLGDVKGKARKFENAARKAERGTPSRGSSRSERGAEMKAEHGSHEHGGGPKK